MLSILQVLLCVLWLRIITTIIIIIIISSSSSMFVGDLQRGSAQGEPLVQCYLSDAGVYKLLE